MEIKTQPQEVTPAYNPIIYEVDSLNKNKNGFRYFLEVFDSNNDLIFTKTVSKRVGDGYGVFSIERELQNLLSYDYKLDISANYDASKSYVNVRLEFGEMFYESWEWDDFIYCATSSTWWANRNNPQINPNGKARVGIVKTSTGGQPPYQIGDIINVDLNTGTQDAPYLQGSHKVIDVVHVDQTSSGQYYGWVVILEEEWRTGGSTTGGESNYADGRKTRFAGLETKDLMAFNAALEFTEFVDYDNLDYILNSPTSKMLTAELENIRRDSYYLVNLLYKGVSKINFKNDNGDESNLSINSSNGITQINLGTNRTSHGTLVAGSFPIIKPNTKWYEVTALDYLDNEISKTYRINIDDSCVVDRIDCLFLDNFGSFIPYSFTLHNEENNRIDRSKFEKNLPNYYEKDDAGKMVYNSEYGRELTLRTDYLRTNEREVVEKLMRSPVMLINYGGQWIRANIKTSSFSLQKQRISSLKKYDLKVELANKEKINI